MNAAHDRTGLLTNQRKSGESILPETSCRLLWSANQRHGPTFLWKGPFSMRSDRQTTASLSEAGNQRGRGAEEHQTLLLSADELAAMLSISKRSLWRLRSAGQLPRPVQLGGSTRWRRIEVEEWVAAGCPSLTDWEAGRGGK